MFGSTEIRLLLVVVAAALAAQYPNDVDQWLWRGLRDIFPPGTGTAAAYTGAAMVVAECLGRWCPNWRPRLRHPVIVSIGLAVFFGVLFWMGRVPYWLGDYHGIDREPPRYVSVEPAEPLGVLISSSLIRLGAAYGVLASTMVQLESVVFGMLAVVGLFLWCRALSAEWPLVLAMLLSSGFMVLFFGYPEKGTIKTAAFVCWYAYVTTLYFDNPTRRRFFGSNLFLSLAVFSHGSGLCWFPAHIWYVWRGNGWKRLLAGILIFLSAGVPPLILYKAGIALYGGSPLGNIEAPVQWIKAYCITNCGYDFFSTVHLRDIFFCLAALSPVALLAFPEAAAYSRTRRERWLLLGSAGWLFLNGFWFPVFGYVGDWDIFATTPLVMSLLVITVASRRMDPENFRRMALVWIACSAWHSYSWWRFFRMPL